MADEINPNISNETTTFISPLNEDTSSVQQSNDYPHIEETQLRRLSIEENNNDSHIQPIQNGNHHEISSNIQSLEPSTENHSSETQFIEETAPIHLQSTSSSHIEPVHIDDQQINEQNPSHINQNSFEESNSVNNDDQSNIPNNDTSNTDTNFQTPTNQDDNPDQFKTQRELDENEIPPTEIPIVETPINNETNDNSPISSTNISDDRPLTELETPYEHHHENQNHSVEFPIDEKSVNNETNLIDNRPLTENESPNSNEINNISYASSLPDVVTETFEQNHGDFISEPIESEEALIEENPVQKEFNLTEEDFPPLPPPSIVVEQTIFNEEDFPPLTSTSIPVEQIFNKEEENPLLSSNNESSPLKSEDVLGNKTLFKQTIVEGISDTRPTRSTMVTISYTLSLVDNLTSNVRFIENISNQRFFVSEFDLIPAIDISVLLMNRGERALIDSDIRHCYGEIGCEEKQIPPISSLNSYRMKIDLELHDWISPPDVQTLSIEERLYWGDKKRQMGNFYYHRQDYKTSLLCYHGATRFLSTDDNPILISFNESQRSILNDRYIQVQNNVAQVNLFLNKYQPCLNAVENVLKYDPRNVKALFRQGKALFELGKYEQAIQSLKLFIQIQKENSNVGIDNDKANEMISISENKLANYQKSEKEIYRRMFQSPPTTTNSTLNQPRQTKTNNQIDNGNNNWWPYIALGSAALAVVGVVTFIKYRKVS